MKRIVLLIGLFLAISCGLREIGGMEENDGVWWGPGRHVVTGSAAPEGKKSIWYAVGVDYPYDYDWLEGKDQGPVKCSLKVFANGVPLMKVPVGDVYEISSDPDMHRMIDGDLYTDYSTQTETVVRKNGSILFRYDAREMMLDMMVVEHDVYTLGQSRSGEGFSFRKNGEVLFSKSSGYAFPGSLHHGVQMCFAFCEPIVGEQDNVERYFVYRGGNVSQVALREDVRKVWDIIVSDDQVSYIASLVGVTAPVLSMGDNIRILELPSHSTPLQFNFIRNQEGIGFGPEPGIEGMLSKDGNICFCALWRGSKLAATFPDGYMSASSCDVEGEIFCVLNGSRADNEGIIYYAGGQTVVPKGYCVSAGGQTLAVVNGLLYVGLTSKHGENASVWVEDEMKPLKINGFISHISGD